MELYKELAALRCFSRRDVVRTLGSESSAAWYINHFLSKGYIERIRRDLYAVISLETSQPIPNRYEIASCVAEDAYVSHHSAFEFYGYANQVFYDVYFSTTKKVRPFSYDGVNYLPVHPPGSRGVVEFHRVRVTGIERTVIDSIADFKKVGGVEELIRCILLVPSLSSEKLLEALELYGYGQLYQKCGLILEALNSSLQLSNQFFVECQKHITGSKTYLFKRQPDFVLYPKWKIYAPKDLISLVDKGGIRDGIV